jgi:hypothetical protein
MAEHRVTYRRIGKEWSASAKGFARLRGRGRTLRQARQKLRAALAKKVPDPYEIDFVEDVRLPTPARALVVRHWQARRAVTAALSRADDASAAAMRALLELRLNVKDVGDLLGLSPPKVQQLKRRTAGA